VLLNGFAQRYKMLRDGRRQILSFHIPGDIPDILSLHLKVIGSGLATLSRSRVGFVPHNSLRRLMQEHPRLTDLLWRDTLIEAATLQEWMVGIGRQRALSRVAHLVCEMVTRLEAVGLAEGKSIELPLTQATIADAVGLSSVRVNRMVQRLRGMGLLAWRGKDLTVKDWNRLQGVAEFDPAYLHVVDQVGARERVRAREGGLERRKGRGAVGTLRPVTARSADVLGSGFRPGERARGMHVSRSKDDERYAALRGPPDPTLTNLIRWERIKLWDAAEAAMALIEDRAPATPEAAERLWMTDAEFAELLTIVRKHRARISELRQIEAEAAMEIAPGPPPPET